MSHWKSFGLTLFAAVYLMGEATGSAHAQNTDFATEWAGGRIIDLGGLPGSTTSQAFGINDAGQVVGLSVVDGVDYATEWSHGHIINLARALP
jgi:probable HAF family extracellular repeat protein